MSQEGIKIEGRKVALKFQNISKTYGRKKVLNNFSMEVLEGSIHAFLGANGAGKTTALRIMAGFVKADNDHPDCCSYVSIQGKIVTKHPYYNSESIFIPVDALFDKKMTVIDYARSVAILRGIPQKEALENLKMSLLSQFVEVKCNDLSTGWKKILQIFAASLIKPKIIILDEPFNGLDIVAQESLMSQIESFKERGGTVLLSTHLFDFVERMADKVTIIKEGSSIYEGPVEDAKNFFKGKYLKEIKEMKENTFSF